MNELTFQQVQDVNGGIGPFAAAAAVAGAIVLAGIVSGYLDHVSQH